MLLINLISIYLLSVAVAVVFCTVQVRILSGASYAKTVLLLCFAVCFYILGYTLELNSSTPSQIAFWNRIEYIGIPFVSALWLTTGLIYTGHFTHHKKLLLSAIYTVPILTFIFRLTNNYHHLYFSSVEYVEEFGGLFFKKTIGPWMYTQLIHSLCMVLISMWLFIQDAVKSKGTEKDPGKILLIVIASFFAVSGLILTHLKPLSFQIDYMALCLPITCIMVILAISRYDLLETKSMARSKVFEASSDAILLINRQNRVLDYNYRAKYLFRQVDVYLENKDLYLLFGKITNLLESLKKIEPSVVKLKVNGEYRYYDITTKNIDDRNELRGCIKTIHDVTEIYQLNEELNRQAMTDELSVLSNRRAFMKTGREWTSLSEETGNSLYLLMMDLDHFKNINDQYGHPAGDLVIREFSKILKSHFNENCLAARLGGEEFAILLSDLTDEEAIQIVNFFLKESEQHIYNYLGCQFNVTVSIGMSKRHPGQTLESMMGKADKALYQSKERGRNQLTIF